MSKKTLIWIGIFVGSTIGSFIPSLWGVDLLSLSSMFWSAMGAVAGIWAGYKLGNYL